VWRSRKETVLKVLITIDQATCVGIGKCEEVAEEAVSLTDDGVAMPTGVPLEEDQARALCEACPTGSITIVGPVE